MSKKADLEISLNVIDLHVGSRLRVRRELVQMSEDWLAGLLAISIEQLRAIEEGTARIGHRELLLCAEALDVPERYFYMGFGEMLPEPERRGAWVRDVDRWFASHVFPHEGLFMSVARRMTGNSDTAREIVQDTYADLLFHEKWRHIEQPKAYALRAVRSIAGRFLQRARIVPIELLANLEDIDRADTGPDAYELLSAKQRRRIILDTIEGLPPQCRRVVKLRRLKEMAPRAIAAEMGISVKMVEKHLAKGMSIIARRLSEEAPAVVKPGQPRAGAVKAE